MGTEDSLLVQAAAEGISARSALITTDKAIRTRRHERAAFTATGCIGIVLRGDWAHAPLWERAVLSVMWWPYWVETIESAQPGTLWQSPWSRRPKRLKAY